MDEQGWSGACGYGTVGLGCAAGGRVWVWVDDAFSFLLHEGGGVLGTTGLLLLLLQIPSHGLFDDGVVRWLLSLWALCVRGYEDNWVDRVH